MIRYFEEELTNLTEISDWERGGNINYHMHLLYPAYFTLCLTHGRYLENVCGMKFELYNER